MSKGSRYSAEHHHTWLLRLSGKPNFADLQPISTPLGFCSLLSSVANFHFEVKVIKNFTAKLWLVISTSQSTYHQDQEASYRVAWLSRLRKDLPPPNYGLIPGFKTSMPHVILPSSPIQVVTPIQTVAAATTPRRPRALVMQPLALSLTLPRQALALRILYLVQIPTEFHSTASKQAPLGREPLVEAEPAMTQV